MLWAIYYERNSTVINVVDELIAFHIKSEFSEGLGVQDAINKAKQRGTPVKVFFTILPNS